MLSNFRSIAYLVGEGQSDEQVARVSIEIARKFGAHVTGAYIQSMPPDSPASSFARGAEAIRSTIERMEHRRQGRARDIGRHVAEMSQDAGVPIEGRVVDAAFGTDAASMPIFWLSVRTVMPESSRRSSAA